MDPVGAVKYNAAMHGSRSPYRPKVLNLEGWSTWQELRLEIVVCMERIYRRQRAEHVVGGLMTIESEASLARSRSLVVLTEPVTDLFLTTDNVDRYRYRGSQRGIGTRLPTAK